MTQMEIICHMFLDMKVLTFFKELLTPSKITFKIQKRLLKIFTINGKSWSLKMISPLVWFKQF